MNNTDDFDIVVKPPFKSKSYGIHTREQIVFDSAESLDRYIGIRARVLAEQMVDELVLDGMLEAREVIRRKYFPFSFQVLKRRIKEKQIRGTVKGDKEVYVEMASLREYMRGCR